MKGGKAGLRHIRIGVIGVGFIGALHIEAIRRVAGTEIAAISVRNQSALSGAMDRFCVEKGYTDWRDLIADPNIDAVHNCTPNSLHDEVNRAAILAGKHIYSEKPLSTSAAMAKDLWQLAVRQGVAHGLNHQYRLNAAVQEMRARVKSLDCGPVLMVRGEYLQESMVTNDYIASKMDPLLGPTRALSDIGTHWMDTACCILGQPIVSLMADLHIFHRSRIDPVTLEKHEMKTEDSAFVMMRFADGTPGLMTVSKVSSGHKNDLTLCVDASVYAMSWRQEEADRLVLGYRHAASELLYMSPHTVAPEVRPYVLSPAGHAMGWSDALRNAIFAYYESIWNGTYQQESQPYATFESGFRGNAFAEACLRSSDEKRWVSVET